MLLEPLRGTAPLAAPPAVQLVTLVALQVRIEDAPLAIDAGEAVTVAVGVMAATATVVDWLALPPIPVQVSV